MPFGVVGRVCLKMCSVGGGAHCPTRGNGQFEDGYEAAYLNQWEIYGVVVHL